MVPKSKTVKAEQDGVLRVLDPDVKAGQEYEVTLAEAEISSPEERARELDSLLKAMQERAKSLGITEADGWAAIEEVRREKR